jgi:hypothetical protein
VSEWVVLLMLLSAIVVFMAEGKLPIKASAKAQTECGTPAVATTNIFKKLLSALLKNRVLFSYIQLWIVP